MNERASASEPAPFSSPGRSARDMGHTEIPPTPQRSADAHTADTGVAVSHPRTEDGKETAPAAHPVEVGATTTPQQAAGQAEQRAEAHADGESKQPKNRK